MNKIGTKELETERLILRRLKNEDYLDAFNNWCNNPKVAKYTTWEAHKTPEITKEVIENWVKQYEDLSVFRWGVQNKETGELMGTIDVVDSSRESNDIDVFEIGYCYGEKFWGKGYGTESLKAVIKYLFEEVGAEVIYAEHLSQNPVSGIVMKKAGMKYEGSQRGRYIDKDGIRNDMISYSILREEYLA